MVVLLTQESRPILITAIEDCVYTFLWLTPAACPLNSTQQDECRVTNPATGLTFTHGRGSEDRVNIRYITLEMLKALLFVTCRSSV